MTTYAQMLELSDPMDCHVRNLGEGSIRVLMWGSVNSNPQMLIRLYGSGKLIVADMTDVRAAHNPGDPRDGIQIPEDWTPHVHIVPSQDPHVVHVINADLSVTQKRDIPAPDLPDFITPS